MKIAIDTADLDCERIDGTRVYIQNVLKYLGKLAPEDEFFLLHKTEYNKLLKPTEFKNYHDKSLGKGFWWTQIKFARAVRKLKADVCWMPIQQIPFLKSIKSKVNPTSLKLRGTRSQKSIKYIVTIHDLAFKFFGDYFPLVDRIKLNWYTDVAVKRADKIIAISEATKRDLIKFYPGIDKNKIAVVYHGFDRKNFEREFSEEERERFLRKWGMIESKVKSRKSVKSIKSVKSDVNVFNDKGGYLKTPQNSRSSNFDPLYTGGGYLLYVGAIQPRKDLVTLVKAFDKIKSQDTRNKQMTNDKLQMTNDEEEMTNDKLQMTKHKMRMNDEVQGVSDGEVSDLKLVLVGEKAWKSESTLREIEKSEFKDDIILTGKVDFKELAMFYRWAKVFVFPSLYEGFGIPILEAMASKTPVIVADNSSLTEVGGEVVLKFKTGSSEDLAKKLRKLLIDDNLQKEMIERGLERVREFSWKKCARETLGVLRGM